MKIYRFENPETGIGPYNSVLDSNSMFDSDILGVLVVQHGVDGKHPGPWNDGLNINSHNFLFGCPSIKSFNEWFNGFAEALVDIGFKIIEYVVPDEYVLMGLSGKQCAFDKTQVLSKIAKK